MKKELPQYGIIQKDIMDSKLPATSKVIYALLSCYANNMGTCYPSVDTICFSLGINKKTFYKYLHPLIDAKIIEVSSSRTSGAFDSNTYQITDEIHLRNH